MQYQMQYRSGVRRTQAVDVAIWCALGHLRVAQRTSTLAEDWTAAVVADRLGMSEATLRRHLAAKSTTFVDFLVDARISFAMKLLQSTDHSINRIALDIGYESASRFAIRFRKRFGFPPSAIRGHHRPQRLAVQNALHSRPAHIRRER